MNWANWAGRQNLTSCQAWGTGGRVNRASCPWPVDSLRNGIFTLDTNCMPLTQQQRTKAGSGLGPSWARGREEAGGEGRGGPQDATRRRVVLQGPHGPAPEHPRAQRDISESLATMWMWG